MGNFTPKSRTWQDPTPAKDLDRSVAAIRLSGKERRLRVRSAIRMAGFRSIADCCRCTGLKPEHIFAMTGEHPQTNTLLRVAVALGVSLDFLLLKEVRRDG